MAGKKCQFNVLVDCTLLKRLRFLAVEQGVRAGQLAEKAISEFLERHEPPSGYNNQSKKKGSRQK